VHFGVIGPVGIEAVGALNSTAGFASNRWDGLHQRDQLSHVVPVGARQLARQWSTVRIGDDVMLAAFLASVGRVRTRLGPPKTARTEELSTTARDKSIRSALRNSSSNMRWMRCQIPASCQSRKRRQQVIPDPQPISWGKSSQGIPVLSTKAIAVSVFRSSSGGRPPFGLGGHFGNKGSTNAQNSSDTSGLAIAPSSLTDGWFTTAFTVAGRNHNENPLPWFC
jgi:hypothetical protein